jgi:hypothetical protein
VLEETENTEIRTEDRVAALDLHTRIRRSYESKGYNFCNGKLIVVPAYSCDENGHRLTVEESVELRAQFVLQKVREYEIMH